jgi:hypothetical protein
MALLADKYWGYRVLVIVLPSNFDSAGPASGVHLDGLGIASCGPLGSGNLCLEFHPSELQNAATVWLTQTGVGLRTRQRVPSVDTLAL